MIVNLKKFRKKANKNIFFRPTARDLLVHPCVKQLKKTNSTLGTILSGMNKIEFKSCDQAKTVEIQTKSSIINAWNF